MQKVSPKVSLNWNVITFPTWYRNLLSNEIKNFFNLKQQTVKCFDVVYKVKTDRLLKLPLLSMIEKLNLPFFFTIR